jgi:hypothetical protein
VLQTNKQTNKYTYKQSLPTLAVVGRVWWSRFGAGGAAQGRAEQGGQGKAGQARLRVCTPGGKGCRDRLIQHTPVTRTARACDAYGMQQTTE